MATSAKSSLPIPILFTWDAPALHSLRQTLNNPLSTSLLSPHLSLSQSTALAHLSQQVQLWIDRVSNKQFPIITNKNFTLPPGAALNHFVSLVPYAYPCHTAPPNCLDYAGKKNEVSCDSTTGLPWVICDGMLNLEAKESTDRPALEHIIHAIIRLSIYAYLFANHQAAEASITLLDTWFINNGTRMLPTLRFAQGVPGVTDGKPSGCIDLSFFGRGFADAVVLLAQTPEANFNSHSSDQVDRSEAFRKWCADMVNEMLHNKKINVESRMRNNHGLFFDLTVLSLSLLAHHPMKTILGSQTTPSFLTSLKKSAIRENDEIDDIVRYLFNTSSSGKNSAKVLQTMLSSSCTSGIHCIKGRLEDQTNSEGAQKHELHRAGFGHYVWYTLLAHLHLFTMARAAGTYLPIDTETPFMRITRWTEVHLSELLGRSEDEWLVYGVQAYRIISRLTRNEQKEESVCKLLQTMYRHVKNRPNRNFDVLWHDTRIGMDVWNIVLPPVNVNLQCDVWFKFPQLDVRVSSSQQNESHDEKNFDSAKRSEQTASRVPFIAPAIQRDDRVQVKRLRQGSLSEIGNSYMFADVMRVALVSMVTLVFVWVILETIQSPSARSRTKYYHNVGRNLKLTKSSRKGWLW